MTAPTSTVEAPTKVCRKCGAMSRTVAARCPNCGKKYKRRTLLKVVLGLLLLGVVLIAGCTALLGSAANEIGKELDAQQAAHAITREQFDALELGASRAAVIDQLGKQPEDAQDFESTGILDDAPQTSSCIYYNLEGGTFGDAFQLCFTDDKLDTKNAY